MVVEGINSFWLFAVANPVIIPTMITALVALFWYFGWIYTQNNWQYQNMKNDRISSIYQGFQFLSVFVLLPLLILWVVLLVLPSDLVIGFTGWLGSWHIGMYFLIIFLLQVILSKLDNWMIKLTADFQNPSVYHLPGRIARFGDLKYIFWLVNYGLILTNPPIWAVFAMLWLDLLVLSKWARLMSLHNQGAIAEISFTNAKQKAIKGRLIEFVGSEKFLKIQIENKEKLDVRAIHIDQIKELKLIQVKPDTSSMVEYLLKKLLRWKLFEEEINKQVSALKKKQKKK